MRIVIEPMTVADWPKVRAIYLEGIATGHATFEVDAPEWHAWDRARLDVGRLVGRINGDVVGFAALSPISSRPAYAGVAEVSIYVAQSSRGQGIAAALLRALIEASERAGLWTLQCAIFPENATSLRLVRGAGFRDVGRRERIGQRDGIWRDTILLERRSPIVGVTST
jgi:phosphinothricin acetyltransferase